VVAVSLPIFTSKGVNTSALFGFTQTLLDLIKTQEPTHLAVAFDTAAPTARHEAFPEYKATRQEMPEDLSAALPHVRRMIEALNVPVLMCDGYEADDIIGTLVRQAERQDFVSYMVTPDKDFGQLVNDRNFIYKPGRMGDAPEILGQPEVCARWAIQKPEQVIDILALMGDASDNIPGVPGIGEKTAIKLISQFGNLEEVLAHASELSGRVSENLQKFRDQAVLSKNLATIHCEVPCNVDLETLKRQPPNEDRLKELLIEFELNSLGKRFFGEEFKAGRGYQPPGATEQKGQKKAGRKPSPESETESETEAPHQETPEAPKAGVHLQKLADVPHRYEICGSPEERKELVRLLQQQKTIGLAIQAAGADPKSARLDGIAFAVEPRAGFYVPLPRDESKAGEVLNEFATVLASDKIAKVGHDLKPVLAFLRWRNTRVGGSLLDTLVAHSLVEPEMRHRLDFLAETFLGYTPAGGAGEGGADQMQLGQSAVEKLSEEAIERADLALQLWKIFEPALKQKGQEKVFYEIESPLIPVLVEMELEGVRVDKAALEEFSRQLGKEIETLEKSIYQLAGMTFNLNSPRQLGQVLFEKLQIGDAPKKTKTGQYATDEQTLAALATDHEIVRQLLEHRTASKLKSTYADTLPLAIWPKTGRIHTTFNQVATTTGRLNSQDPNLQNIPIRTERGQEIRRAFVARGPGWVLLSADYSQIELRIIAALSKEPGLLEAFQSGQDVHTATAAKVYGVPPEAVTPDMRRKAKMVNYGIAYGISAFGLAQRLGIPRREASEIIDNYFRQFSGIRGYLDSTIAFAREHGYVETVTGRRRYLRDIRSANNTVRGAAERNAVNMPMQGTAADMIKIAMVNINREFQERNFRSRMLLQVHDELVFDLWQEEEKEVRRIVEQKMKSAIDLPVPIEVEMGTGATWLEAH
jgi:DNA polymerase-1